MGGGRPKKASLLKGRAKDCVKDCQGIKREKKKKKEVCGRRRRGREGRSAQRGKTRLEDC